MWTRFRNDGNVPTQYAASTASDRIMKFAHGLPRRFPYSYGLRKYQVANEVYTPGVVQNLYKENNSLGFVYYLYLHIISNLFEYFLSWNPYFFIYFIWMLDIHNFIDVCLYTLDV